MRKFLTLAMAALLALPMTAVAAGHEDAMIQELQKQIQELSGELEELVDRMDSAERHATLDRIEFTGDLRAKVDSLHYNDITVNQAMLVDGAQSAVNVGNLVGNGVVSGAVAALLPALPATTFAFPRGLQKFDQDNQVMYTSRLRLNMKAKIWENMKFIGRLTMYKNWGDSSGAKVFDSFDSFTMDGTNSGNTTGDLLHVERAFFDWSKIGGTPFYLSIGRRPSTYGIPSNFRENELRGGTPSGHSVNFNFDGITVGYGLEEATGIPGMTARFCYGQGFESEYGNGSLFSETDLDDTHLAGFNIDWYNDGYTILQSTIFKAWDVVDSFKGIAVMPFADMDGDGVPEGSNNNAYISRFQGQQNLGDMLLGSLTFSREEENGFTWFASLGWTQTDPSNAYNPMGLGGLLYDAVPIMAVSDVNYDPQTNTATPVLSSTGNVMRSNNWDQNRDGHSVYVGFQTPAPLGKFGLEYNYGSKYWAPFTQAQDDVVGSKLATRGHVGEAYYIFEINPKAFIKVGALYYDYEYTGSGSPVGKPKEVSKVQSGLEYSLLPVVDKVWDINASITMKF